MEYDVLIVGGGLLGCFVARNLSRYACRVLLIEQNPDVCMGVSRANTAIVYPGYDPEPGSLKARLSVAANRRFEALCRELDVPYAARGSLMVAFGPRGQRVLRQKWEQGAQNGVKGLRFLLREDVLALEPGLNPAVEAALYAPSAGTVSPWELGIAAAESAAAGGVQLMPGTKLHSVMPIPGGYRAATSRGEIRTRLIVNCAGLHGDEVHGMMARPAFRIQPTRAEYTVLDDTVGGIVRHIVQHEPEGKGRGATLVPTVDGNLLLGPTKSSARGKADFATTREGLAFIREAARFVFPALPLGETIRSFASLRPGLELSTGERMRDLYIFEAPDAPGTFHLAGIKTPGLTCCDEIGSYVAAMVAQRLGGPGQNPSYSPQRSGIRRFAGLPQEQQEALLHEDSHYGSVVCRCRNVTEAEVREAIRRGAHTVDGVKRRTGAGMGRCQGGYCAEKVIKILADALHRPVDTIEKDAPGSSIVRERVRRR